MEEGTDVIVIGAGVVGLAVARSLAMQGREVIVVERHGRAGQETSSRNSGVIHSGLYYPTGSLKARLCRLGREQLYTYCAQRDVSHRRCGKLIVAQEAQLGGLRRLQQQGVANGVDDLQWLSSAQAQALEPRIRCAAALRSPATGIVDVHGLMNALHADIEVRGGHVVVSAEFLSAQACGERLIARIRSGTYATKLECRWLVNSAGLSALTLLAHIAGYPEARRRRPYYAEGNYFVCNGMRPFTQLVYPMPSAAGLGVHATLDTDGGTRFGPDVEWVDEPEYHVDPARAPRFYAAIREYWPSLPDGALQPGYAGVRPKLVGPEASAADFEIEGPQQHGVGGLINLLGIEFPGLTSALAIGEELAHATALA
jgi:L-2-hydroxyglutarate oxidase LhgO